MNKARWAAFFISCTALAEAGQPGQLRQTGRAAYEIVDVESGWVLERDGLEQLDLPIQPGSVLKIAALAAALEAGAISDATAIRCERPLLVEQRDLTCSHPDLRRPLTPSEALAHSCNSFFATLARRLPRQTFETTMTALGLPRPPPASSTLDIVLGLGEMRATPRQLLAAFVRLMLQPRRVLRRPGTIGVLLDGLAAAARQGTAAAFGAGGINAWAKTGTSPMAGGGVQGLVIAMVNPGGPAIVLIAPGAAGQDAATLAATLLSRRVDRVRIGLTPSEAAPQTDQSMQPRYAGSSRARPPEKLTETSTFRRASTASDGGREVAEWPLEEYVARVVAGEAVPSSRSAALEALAVTVRSYAVVNRGRHRAEGFDFCDLTHCQVPRPATRATRAAASTTRGQILLQQGRAAQVFYTASCGGRSEAPSAVWPGAEDPAFLKSRDDEACKGEPEWTSDIPADDLVRALGAVGFRGSTLLDVRVGGRTASGRVARLVLAGLTPGEISGQDFRLAVGRSLGWQLVKSTAFDLQRTAAGYRFRGRGFGHGVGLCVVGSSNLAVEGASAAAILARYFPDLELAPRVTPTVDVALPPSERHEAAGLRDRLTRMRDELAAALAVVPPAHIGVYVHTSADAYRRATGRAWWTAAASRGTRIDVMPLDALRERGTLEVTLRHELAHALTGAMLASRPLWVKEGVALHFAGGRDRAIGQAGRRPCPSDSEITNVATAAALRDAYGRARACVARELARGRRWEEIR